MTPEGFKHRRVALGLSQVKLAEALGVTSTTVARWERGERRIAVWVDNALDALERERAAV